MFHEDELPAILNLHDQPIVATLDIEYRKWFDEVSVGVNCSKFGYVLPSRTRRNLVPPGNRAFEGRVSCDRLPPRSLANDVHYIRHFAIREV